MRLLFVVLQLLPLFITDAISNNSTSSSSTSSSTSSNECGVYLAPSTIPGAGLGMYAGKSFGKGERVTYGDIIFPIIELNWHNGHENFFWLWDEYTWSHSVEESMEFETEGSTDLSAASPGIGAALNCILALVNLEDTVSTCDNAGLHRHSDPGAGAVTPYHDRGSKATRRITEGDELFIDYGENYFVSRKAVYGPIPLEENIKEADTVLYHFHVLQHEVLKYYPDSLTHDLWKIVTSLDTRTSNALPSKVVNTNTNRMMDDAAAAAADNSVAAADNNVAADNTVGNNNDDSIAETLLKQGGTGKLHQDRSRRTVAWLHEHGQCMDNIRNGLSDIPQAGRGAFATRFLTAESLVAPAPLIHIPHKAKLTMYDMLPPDEEGVISRNVSAPIHQQLLLNYCFGHADSNVLMSPYGVLVNLINHGSSGSSGTSGNNKYANTRIVWSKEMRHPEWLEQPPKVMESDWHSGLSFDFIALRDIEEGEEILIDYGPDWQAAWDDHVAHWKAPSLDSNNNDDGSHDSYDAAYELNGIQSVDSILPTMSEGGYGGSVKMWIHGAYVDMAIGHDEARRDFSRVEIVDRYVDANVDDGAIRYRAQTFEEREAPDARTEIEYQLMLWSLPRDAFVFDDLPYTRDHVQTWSFRHAIGIPDDMFPNAWKLNATAAAAAAAAI